MEVEFPAGKTVVIAFELVAPAAVPVEQRPDLGIGRGDVRVSAEAIDVTVHSLGHADAPTGFVVLEDAHGREVARAAFVALEAPRDLEAKTANVRLAFPAGGNSKGSRLRIATDGEMDEVTQRNNAMALP